MLPEPIQLIRDLVQCPSVSAADPELDQSNQPVLDVLSTWLEDLGFAIEHMPVEGVTGASGPRKANLIATLGRGDGGLVLAGHTDTVPWDEGRWHHDPFAGQVEGGRIYGLGTADMKGFLALATEAARAFRADQLKRPLVILATADEETTMGGARALLASGRLPGRHAIIGEPTNLVPIHLHKGVMAERIELVGQAGHASDPALGNNALDGMYAVLGALMTWRAELARRHRDPRFKVPMPTLNLGHVHGGDAPNRICGQCELLVDLRPLPGMDLDDLRAEMTRVVEAAVAETGLHLSVAPLFDAVPPFETPAGAAVVQATAELTGAEPATVTFGTEGPFFRAMGMEPVVLGPGDIGRAHQPDESLDLDTLGPTVELLGQLIHRFCVEPDT